MRDDLTASGWEYHWDILRVETMDMQTEQKRGVQMDDFLVDLRVWSMVMRMVDGWAIN